jgi:FkbM family methyltransferase
MIRYLLDQYFIKQPKVRRFLTKLIYGTQDRVINLCGSILTVNSLRENGYLRAARKLKGSSFLEEEVSVLITLSIAIKSADTFIDIGANIGVFSSFIARTRLLFDDGFRILAFEPHPDTFLRLKRNVEHLGVEVHNVGLGSEKLTVDFVDGSVSHVFTNANNATSYNIPSELVPVNIVRLDSFNLYDSRNFLKIDVEGQELDVLNGASALFDRGAVSGVYIDGFVDKAVIDFLKLYNFRLFDLRKLTPSTGDAFALLALRN